MTDDQKKERERNLKNGFPDLQIPNQLTPMELFIREYFSHYLRYSTPEFHRELYWILQNRHLFPMALLVAPRYYGKSYVAILFDVLYDIYIRANPAFAGNPVYSKIYNPDLKEICFACETATKAKKWMRLIRREVTQNKAILEDFGDLSTSDIRDEQWNQQILTFKTGLTIYGFGCEGGRGEHPQKIILDDIESKESARSKERCDNITDWILSTLLGMFEDEYPPITWIGTILRAGCVIDNAYEGTDDWDESWYRRKWGCYDENGKSIWPSRWPDKKLEIKKRQMGYIRFGQEMENKAYGSANPVYRRHHIKYYKKHELPSNLYTVTAIDPAIGQKRENDEAAIVTYSLCLTGINKSKIYCRRVDHGRWGKQGIIDTAFDHFHEFHSQVIGFEKNGFDILKEDFDLEALNRGVAPSTRAIHQSLDKWTRASMIISLYDSGLVYYIEDDSKQRVLVNQLLNFPGVSHDDMHDAQEIALKLLKVYVTMIKRMEAQTTADEDEDDVRSIGLRKIGVA